MLLEELSNILSHPEDEKFEPYKYNLNSHDNKLSSRKLLEEILDNLYKSEADRLKENPKFSEQFEKYREIILFGTKLQEKLKTADEGNLYTIRCDKYDELA